MSRLSAHEYLPRRINSSDYEFQTPDYRRRYSWNTDHALQLPDDLAESLARGLVVVLWRLSP